MMGITYNNLKQIIRRIKYDNFKINFNIAIGLYNYNFHYIDYYCNFK